MLEVLWVFGGTVPLPRAVPGGCLAHLISRIERSPFGPGQRQLSDLIDPMDAPRYTVESGRGHRGYVNLVILQGGPAGKRFRARARSMVSWL